MKHADLRDLFNRVFRGVCTSTIVSPDPFSPPSTSPALEIPENAEEDTYDPEPADEGNIQMDYQPNHRGRKK